LIGGRSIFSVIILCACIEREHAEEEHRKRVGSVQAHMASREWIVDWRAIYFISYCTIL